MPFLTHEEIEKIELYISRMRTARRKLKGCEGLVLIARKNGIAKTNPVEFAVLERSVEHCLTMLVEAKSDLYTFVGRLTHET